jgi:hypothetical protein
MRRREFLLSTGVIAAATSWDRFSLAAEKKIGTRADEFRADVVIVGGGLGGCAAAISALRAGLRVLMTEETDWIGGQLTSQAVPPDEHRWIETHGANFSYRELRSRIRDHYRKHYPLQETARAKTDLNPGNGSVSRLCHEPRVALAVLGDWLAPWLSSGKLRLLLGYLPVAVELDGDSIRAVTIERTGGGDRKVLTAPYFLDATELGDLLPLSQTEFVTGAEARSETGELHGADLANPHNQQAFTMCFAIDHIPGEEHVIEKPSEYDFWRGFVPRMTPPWPGKLVDFTYTHPPTGLPRKLGFDPNGGKTDGVVNLWVYRRLIDRSQFVPGSYVGDISLVNWPQNDYFLGNLVGVTREERDEHVRRATQLSLSWLYWLQTEAPRADGGLGHPGLRLRGDLLGSDTGVAKFPYVRESRRILAMLTVTERHVGREQREKELGRSEEGLRAESFADSVGIGSYPIDLHPSTGGDNYIDFPSLPFEIPLGALIPKRVENLIAASKNIGVTHITQGCYRLHPVEWGIGEAAGLVVAQAIDRQVPPRKLRDSAKELANFQGRLVSQGVELRWP